MSEKDQEYKKAADAALADFQAGNISYAEWNRLQRAAVDGFHK